MFSSSVSVKLYIRNLMLLRAKHTQAKSVAMSDKLLSHETNSVGGVYIAIIKQVGSHCNV